MLFYFTPSYNEFLPCCRLNYYESRVSRTGVTLSLRNSVSEMDEIIAAVTTQVEVYHQAAVKTLVLHDGPSQAGLTLRLSGQKCMWSEIYFDTQ